MQVISNVADEGPQLEIGNYTLDEDAIAYLNGNRLFQRHAIVVGSTGSGKSWTTARLLDQVAALKQANAILFDVHGEYKPLAGDEFRHYRVAGPGDLDNGKGLDEGILYLPYWLLGYEAMVSLFVDRSDQNAPNQAMVMARCITNAKCAYLETGRHSDILENFTVDSAVPFDLSAVVREMEHLDTERVEGAKAGTTKAGDFNGVPLVPIVLGLFALPEIADLAIARTSIARVIRLKADARSGQWEGVKDTFRNWWLVTRVSFIGAGLGAVPGLGNAVVDWVAYGHAARSEKGAANSFGKGDIRGVLASEGSNNAKDGGGLVPTIAFGVPGSTSMALLLGVFLIHGLTPGPEMIVHNLDVTYSMVWSIALANIAGTGICFLFANQFARLALIRHSIIAPIVLSLIFIGAFQGTRSWGDIYALLIFGLVGWFMKRLGWPRPPLILGVVLGTIVERYAFFSVNRYGWEWLWKEPFVVPIVFLVSLAGLLSPLLKEWRRTGSATGFIRRFDSKPTLDWQLAAYLFTAVMFGAWIFASLGWGYATRLGPQLVAVFGISILALSFVNHVFRRPEVNGEVSGSMHFDLKSTGSELSRRVLAQRALIFTVYILGFVVVTALFGMLAAGVAFVVAYMRLEGREPWRVIIPSAVGLLIFCVAVFDQALHLPWPEPEIMDLIVELRRIVESAIRS